MSTIIHEGQPIAMCGVSLKDAQAAMILLHGRGSNAHDALGIVEYIEVPGVAYLAPQAANHTWYPFRFMDSKSVNEPHLSSAQNVIKTLVEYIQNAGIPAEKTFLCGFSQGACLAAEYVARHPQQYGGLVVLSGGLIGKDEELVGYEGSLDGTPVFIGCSDADSHIPLDRVHRTTAIFQSLGASVDERIYPGMGHEINEQELSVIKAWQQTLLQL